MIALRAEKLTGVVTVRCGSKQTNLYMRAGALVFADEGTSSDVSRDASRDQSRGHVMRLLQWPDELSFAFDASTARVERAPSFPIAIEELLLDAIRWMDDQQKNDLGLFASLGKKLGVAIGDRADVAQAFSR